VTLVLHLQDFLLFIGFLLGYITVYLGMLLFSPKPRL